MHLERKGRAVSEAVLPGEQVSLPPGGRGGERRLPAGGGLGTGCRRTVGSQ